MKKRTRLNWFVLGGMTLMAVVAMNVLDGKVFDKLNPFAKKADAPHVEQTAPPSSVADMQGAETPIAQQVQNAVDDKAIALLTERAQSGDAAAQVKLGMAYIDGEGVSQNRELGLTWLKQAAINGNMTAREILGEAGVPFE